MNLDSEPARWRGAQSRFARLGIADRVVRFPSLSTPSNHHVGCGLTHRTIVEKATGAGLETVLVFEDDVIFTVDALDYLAAALDEIRNRDWDVLYLGGCRWGRKFPKVDGCSHLEHAGIITCTHAIAYRETVYEEILNEIPSDVPSMESWVGRRRAIDQYYALSLRGRKLLVSPVIAVQEEIIPLDDDNVRERIAASDLTGEIAVA